MDKYEVKEPKQKRSIDKKNRIIKAGQELFCEKGYYKTNTVDIAERAGVSTGIIYRYYTDKKAIFIDSMGNLYNNFYDILFIHIENMKHPLDFENFLNMLIDDTVEYHNCSNIAYGEIMALSYSDPEIGDYFHRQNKMMIQRIAGILESIGIKTEYPAEKIHLIFDMVESYCHEVAFARDGDYNYDTMKLVLIKSITDILKS